MTVVHSDGKPIRNRGDAAMALAASSNTHEADYYAPHLAHAAMEPLVATAEVNGDECELCERERNWFKQ